jgi:hypothetical protein
MRAVQDGARSGDEAMRIQIVMLACVLVAGCGQGFNNGVFNNVSNQHVEAASAGSRACIDREAPAVALTKLDVKAAAMATLQRCAAALEAERRAFQERYPSGQDDQRLKEMAAVRFDQAATAIAMERAARE